MDSNAKDFLREMLETPSPSGYERPVQDLVRAYTADFADDVSTDTHGNVIARRGDGQGTRVYLAGHCDQIGLLVSYVSKSGFLYMQTVGRMGSAAAGRSTRVDLDEERRSARCRGA